MCLPFAQVWPLLTFLFLFAHPTTGASLSYLQVRTAFGYDASARDDTLEKHGHGLLAEDIRVG